MSDFVQDLPFTTENTTNNVTTLLNTCQDTSTVPQNDAVFSTNNPFCAQQLLNRKNYLKAIQTNQLRATIFPGPYPTFTPEQLAMRRKADILQYKGNARKLTIKNIWTKLITSPRTDKICFNNRNIPTSSTASNVPFPIVTITYDDSIPLYNLNVNTLPYNSQPYPLLDESWSSTVQENVQIDNFKNGQLMNVIFINPDSIQNPFFLSFPLSINVSGIFYSFSSDVSYLELSLSQLTLNISDNGGGIEELSTSIYTTNLNTFKVELLDSGSFNATFFIGNAIVSSLNLPSCPEYNYNLLLQPFITVNQFDSSGNVASSPITITPSIIANIENNSAYTFNETNCSIHGNQAQYHSFSFYQSK